MRLIALCDLSDGSSDVSAVGVSAAATSVNLMANGSGKQNVLILEGEVVENSAGVTSPIALELKKMISIRIFETSPSASNLHQHQISHGLHPPRHNSVGPNASGNHQQHNRGGSVSVASPDGTAGADHHQALAVEPPKVESIVPTSKGFMLLGGNGFVALFEKHVDKKESFVEIRRLHLGDLAIVGATLIQGDEKLVILTKNNRLLTYLLNTDSDVLSAGGLGSRGGSRAHTADNGDAAAGADNEGAGASSTGGNSGTVGLINAPTTCHDLYRAGSHFDGIIGADMAVEKPFFVTIGTDNACRAWNYETMTCLFVHNFRSDEPLGVAAHPSGFQVRISNCTFNVCLLTNPNHVQIIDFNCIQGSREAIQCTS
jgi:hypothetical protein